MNARLAADAILVIHAAFIAFVVVGQALILIGLVRRWRWVRNFGFRAAHLLAIAIVVAEAWLGLACPLTTWEAGLRAGTAAAGETEGAGDEAGFIAYWLHRALFFDAPPWVFTLAYSLFGAAVLAAFVWGPPAFPRTRRPRAEL